ncbi:hypothetical protein HDV00_008808 [Rhizophlyctis rosea]|nr:hypothetical protein HDV00_008808 [Rhizophlyctis rosea]
MTMMKYTAATLLAILPLVASHGQMLNPPPRTSASQGTNDYLRQPLNLRSSLFPGGTAMEPCGGMSRSDSSTPATAVTPGQTLNVNWEIGFWTGAALHQGNIQIQISNDEGDWQTLSTVDLTGDDTVDKTPHSVDVTLPDSLGSNPMLRWYWTAGVTEEKYINCADLTTSGGGGGGSNSNSDSSNSDNNNQKNGGGISGKKTNFQSDNTQSSSNGSSDNSWNSDNSNSSSDNSGNPNSSNGSSNNSWNSDSSSGGSCAPQWGQCVGNGWQGASCCQDGFSCTTISEWYSQCE